MIECVLFDLDGVLVEAKEWHYEALNKALEEVVGYSISREDHLFKYDGLPTKVKLEKLNIDLELRPKILQLKQEYTTKIAGCCHHDIFKVKLMKKLKNRDIKIGCVTNSIWDFTRFVLERMGLFQYMDIVITNEDVTRNKPHPDPYNLAIDELNVNPKHTLIVEDSRPGLAAAMSSKASLTWRVDNSKEVCWENLHEIINTYGR